MVNQNISQTIGQLEVQMVDNERNDRNDEICATQHFNILDAPLFSAKGDHP